MFTLLAKAVINSFVFYTKHFTHAPNADAGMHGRIEQTSSRWTWKHVDCRLRDLSPVTRTFVSKTRLSILSLPNFSSRHGRARDGISQPASESQMNVSINYWWREVALFPTSIDINYPEMFNGGESRSWSWNLETVFACFCLFSRDISVGG